MKITGYNEAYPHQLAGALGTGAYSAAQAGTALGSNLPLIESGSGAVGSGPQAAAWDHVHPALVGASSFGSNSTRVSKNASAGSSASNARADHIHDGIGTITASASNTLGRGTLNLRSGNNLSIGWTDTDGDGLLDTATFHAVPGTSGASGVSSIAKSGSAALTGAVTLTGGTNITLTQAGQDISIASTGGSGSTIQYGSLKPGSPTYDHAGSAIDGAFTAHSSQGSFATTNCYTQALDGSHLAMTFSAQMGALHVSHTNTDFDFQIGNLSSFLSNGANGYMIGIAALNSAGTGVGIVRYSADQTTYFATITTWAYNTFSDSFASSGLPQANNGAMSFPASLRLKRISGTWTGYVSLSGTAWDKTFSTRADSITVDRLVVGMFLSTAVAYNGVMFHDYFHVTT